MKKHSEHSTSLRSRRIAAEHSAPLPPPSFEEACAIVADLFEAIPEMWTKCALARTESGSPTGELAPDATCWCVIGALQAMGVKDPWPGLNAVAKKIVGRDYSDTDYNPCVEINNQHGREATIKMLRMAAGQIRGVA